MTSIANPKSLSFRIRQALKSSPGLNSLEISAAALSTPRDVAGAISVMYRSGILRREGDDRSYRYFVAKDIDETEPLEVILQRRADKRNAAARRKRAARAVAPKPPRPEKPVKPAKRRSGGLQRLELREDQPVALRPVARPAMTVDEFLASGGRVDVLANGVVSRPLMRITDEDGARCGFRSHWGGL